MTQLQYYTTILRGVVLLSAWTGGVLVFGSLALFSYYLSPCFKK